MQKNDPSIQLTVDSTSSSDSTQIKSPDANNNQCENVQSNSQNPCENMNNDYFDKFDSEQDRKLFIGYGLNLTVNERLLEDFFNKFGTVEKVIIKRDVLTDKQRGFAFITMAKPEDVQKVLNANPLTIKGKPVDVKLAKSRPISKKVFVGGIDPNLTKEEITSYFNTFGKVIDIELPYDRMKKKRREFCFIIFESEDSANLASEKSKQTIFSRECDVKKACPQPIAQQQKRQNLQQSYNGTHTQAGFSPANHYSLHNIKNSKTAFLSPNSMKNGGSSYRSGYRVRNSMSRNNAYYQTQNGRRSVDSQYSTIYEHNNASSYNSNFGGRKGGYHQSNNRTNQYLQNGNQNKVYNAHHSKQQSYQQVQSIAQPLPPQQQAFYDPIAQQQNYYNYQVPYANDYYTTQHYAQQTGQLANTNAATLNTYAAQTSALQHTANYASYNQQTAIDPTQYLAYQYQYTLNQTQLNGNLTTAVNPTNLTTITQPQTSTGDYHPLDERYFQEQQKKFENNLMNNYEKFDGLKTDDVTAYQTQLINNNNLLNVQYQGPIQQC